MNFLIYFLSILERVCYRAKTFFILFIPLIVYFVLYIYADFGNWFVSLMANIVLIFLMVDLLFSIVRDHLGVSGGKGLINYMYE